MFRVCVVLLCYWAILVSSQEEEHDECKLSTGEDGTCELISKCSYAQDLLHKNGRPKHCGFSPREPIVCCPRPQLLPSGVVQEFSQKETPATLSKAMCNHYHPKPLFDFHVQVTGGKPSLAKEFPHMASIGFGNKDNIKWLCGGSLISLSYVLTAAHCAQHPQYRDARWIRLGDLDLSTDTDVSRPQNFEVKRFIVHPGFRPPSKYNDIALIELDKPITKTQFVAPACLQTEKELPGDIWTATGWGDIKYGGEASSKLLQVELARVPHEKCAEAFRSTSTNLLPRGVDDGTQICAGGVLGKDTCPGDSGGPLQVRNFERTTFNKKVNTVLGVISFGKPCGLSKSPGVYTRVSAYLPWIEEFAWANESSTSAVYDLIPQKAP